MSQAKYRVRLLGGVALEMEGVRVAGRACQRKRLALLGLLGAASGHRLSRDKVLSYLWAEVDAHRARNALSQLLHGLKQQLGAAVAANSDEIWLNNALIAVDVAQFRAAIAASDWNTAISLYGGPFLDGFFIKAGPDFEHWVDELRSGLKLDYAFALQRAALAASNCGHSEDAARAWRRLVSEDPLSAWAVTMAMESLAAIGEVAAALALAKAYQGRMRNELNAAPDAAVERLAEQLRVGATRDVRRLAAPVHARLAGARRPRA